MPSAVPHSLTEDEIDDLLFAARIGSLPDMQETLANISAPPSTLWPHAIDAESGNGVMHMAAANGHVDILNHIISTLSSGAHPFLDLPNLAGNTALHWASLNGQLEAVILLVAAGADIALKNAAGHDAAYEAERADKTEVAEYLLKERKEIGTGAGETSASDEQELDSAHEDGDKNVAATGLEPGRTNEHTNEEMSELEDGISGMTANGKGP